MYVLEGRFASGWVRPTARSPPAHSCSYRGASPTHGRTPAMAMPASCSCSRRRRPAWSASSSVPRSCPRTRGWQMPSRRSRATRGWRFSVLHCRDDRPAAARPAPIRSRPRLRRLSSGAPERVADGVWLLRGGLLRTMNVYLVEEPDGSGVTVYDAGEKGMAGAIVAAAAAVRRHQAGRPRPRRHRPPRCRTGAARLRRRPLPPRRGRAGPGLRRPRLLADGRAATRRPAAARLQPPLRVGRRTRPHRRHGQGGRCDRGVRGHRPARPRTRADRPVARSATVSHSCPTAST